MSQTGHPQVTSQPTAPGPKSLPRRYAWALGSVAVWLLLSLGTPLSSQGNALLLGLAGVTASAWHGGVGPGLLATLLMLLSVDFVFPALRAAGGLRPSLFASVAILVSALSQAKKQAEDGLERSLDTLERRVRERTEELTAANAALSAQMSERRKAEEAYRELFENADDMVFTLDLSGTFTSLNKVGERLTGQSRLDAGQLKLEDVVSPLHRVVISDALAGLRTDAPSSPLRIEVRGQNGLRTNVEMSLRLIQRSGSPAGIHGVARDLTDRERLESELRQSHKLEAIGHLAGGVAHDFNNILMVIQGYSEMLMAQAGTEPHREDLQQIRVAARRGSDLTRQLLAFGRKQVLRVVPLDLNAVVHETSQMLTRLIGENISLRIDTALDPCVVEADKSQLEQVLMNLAVNARDAMSRGGLLTVSVARTQATGNNHAMPEGSYVTLTMTDTGCGMDDATKERVFEPFFTTKPPGKGSGLGLSTVYGVAKQLGGDVTVDSTPLQGTVFTVYLPATSKAAEAPHEATIPELASGQSETVLLVEDDDPVRALLCSVLRRHGYNVLESRGPKQALSIAARHTGPLDLVLSDVIMPEMSGPEMVALLRSIRQEPAVLYLSGYATDALVTDRVLPKAVSFVQKPVSTRQLLEAIRRVLSAHDPAALRAAS
jgi:two-component system, cell cycle sensor histidine kinase and response regulator CckA